MINQTSKVFRWQLLVLFSLSIAISFSQNTVQDSLLNRHLNERLPDTARMRALLDLGETNYRKDSLLYYHQQFGALFQEKGTPADLLDQMLQLGMAYFRTNQYSEALSQFINAAPLAGELRDTVKIIAALNGQGICHTASFDNYLASQVQQTALGLAKLIGDNKEVCRIEGNLGIAFLMLKEYEKAIEYFQPAQACAIEQKDTLQACRKTYGIGYAYQNQGNNEKALEFLQLALDLAEDKEYTALLAAILSALGSTQIELGLLPEASQSLYRALDVAQQTNQPAFRPVVQLSLASLYRNNQADSAFYLANQALSGGTLYEDLGTQKGASELLFELYQERGDYQSAIGMQRQWKILEDSISRMENQRAISDIEARSEYEKQKLVDDLAHQEEVAQQKLAAQRRFYALLGGVILIVLALLSLLRHRRESSQRERQKLLHEIDLLKERVAVRSINASGVSDDLHLDRQRIESHLGLALGESSWMILSLVFENPSISNKEIAAEVFLSLEGVSSSLRRMYKTFQVQSKSKHNMKVALATKAAKISLNT